jgi:exosortase/archaeosortase family protein
LWFSLYALSISSAESLGSDTLRSAFASFVPVPWPGDLELLITQNLMQAAASVTVQALHLFGIPALQNGNLIEVKTGLLGINEACSGIRSFQATLMVSLFLGELYQMSWRRRLVLVFSGVWISFLCNAGRTFLLSWVAAEKGIGSVSLWHDPAGFTILGVCFFGLWGVAHLLAEEPRVLKPSTPGAPRPFPRRQIIGLGAWLLFTVLGAEIWYRAHETGMVRRWSFEWPVQKKQFFDVAIADPLGDERRAASWTDTDGSQWLAFFFRWDYGPARSRIVARMHRPEICLPEAGYKLKTDRGTLTIHTRELSVPFHSLNFDYEGRPVYVFYCLWQDHQKDGEQPRLPDQWDHRLIRARVRPSWRAQSGPAIFGGGDLRLRNPRRGRGGSVSAIAISSSNLMWTLMN